MKKSNRVIRRSFLWIFLLISYWGLSQNSKEQNSLSNSYKKYFPIGAAVGAKDLKKQKLKKVFKANFKSLTAENEMKPTSLLNEDGTYKWEEADEMIAFAKRNNIAVRGHTLLWHKQTPDWFFQDKKGNDLSKDELYQRFYNYMKTVMDHFDYVDTWDVVNEAVSNKNQSPNIYRQEKSRWFDICGEEFVEKAFRIAHAIAPEKKLFYNDFNLIHPKKQDKAYKMLKSLLDKGVPIDGIGIQAHWHVDVDPKEIEAAIQRFVSLGLEIQITELDISFFTYRDNHRKADFNFTPEAEERQANAYKAVFDVFRKYKDQITSVTFWGVSDKDSWLNNHPVKNRRNYPLLFNDDYEPKKSFYSIIENIE